MVDIQAEFELTQQHCDAVNSLLSTCNYVAGIRQNETGEIRFCPQHTEWGDSSLGWWSTGNMGCDCNRELDFRRAGGETPDSADIKCGDDRFTLVGIWFPDGSDIRDLFLLNDF